MPPGATAFQSEIGNPLNDPRLLERLNSIAEDREFEDTYSAIQVNDQTQDELMEHENNSEPSFSLVKEQTKTVIRGGKQW